MEKRTIERRPDSTDDSLSNANVSADTVLLQSGNILKVTAKNLSQIDICVFLKETAQSIERILEKRFQIEHK